MLGHEILFIFFLTLTSKSSWAHVGLTFPPARQYDLDFLDNVRTRPPCGMPKGKANHLNLLNTYLVRYKGVIKVTFNQVCLLLRHFLIIPSQYDLEFLDNVRTRPPCGMPKGKASHLKLLNAYLVCSCQIPRGHTIYV